MAAMSRGCRVAMLLALCAGCAQGGFSDGGILPDASGQPDAGRPSLDAGRDAGQAPADAGTVVRDAGPPVDAFVPSCPPSPGNLAIVEVMVASRSGSGDLGEWFEVKNVGACTIALAGLVIASPSAPEIHTVGGGLLPPGSLFVFAQSDDPADNHGLTVDHVYGGAITFGNSADSLVLSYEGAEIDRVHWSSTSFRVGTARQRSNDATRRGGDLSLSPWCDSTNEYSSAAGGPYFGTPGIPNHGC